MPSISLHGYEVLVAPRALDDLGGVASRTAPAHRYAIITDDTVAPLYAARAAGALGAERSGIFRIPAGEAYKTRESWARLTDELLAGGFGRDTTVVALGGGVVGDLAGFVAATYMRGVPVVQVPTTLLAMIDASIGGKTGVDTPAGKNLVGAFHSPAAVVVDPDTLATLPAAQLRAGAAEAIKHGIIADAGYFERVAGELPALLADPCGNTMRELITGSIVIKAGIVTRDEREGGVRKALNFGHTLGHAIEAESGYRLLHGEAVAIGMTLEGELAERLGIAERGTAALVRDAVERAGLPSRFPSGMTPERILAATRSDKKARRGTVEYALPRRVGEMDPGDGGWGIAVPDDAVMAVLG
ncbi:MAG TPA: 3-dehydroquinate synthase [Gemmatimonadaceae bacterium]|nr:3-dehydroquinate synthase [Gemmatimonadaceae bacterium]